MSWKCKGCGFNIFSNKIECRKCHLDRFGKSTISNRKQTRRVGDWNCKGCDYLVFGSKSACIKCKLDRFGNSVNKTLKKELVIGIVKDVVT